MEKSFNLTSVMEGRSGLFTDVTIGEGEDLKKVRVLLGTVPKGNRFKIDDDPERGQVWQNGGFWYARPEWIVHQSFTGVLGGALS